MTRRVDARGQFEFHKEPLGKVLQSLRERFKIEIRIDRSLNEGGRIDPHRLVDVTLPDATLRWALETMLDPLDLHYSPRGEVLAVVAKDELHEHLTTKVYPVRDLVLGRPGQKRADFLTVVEAITANVAPQGWDATGGRGSIGEFRQTLALVIDQSDEAHGQIEKLLADMRGARGGRPREGKATK